MADQGRGINRCYSEQQSPVVVLVRVSTVAKPDVNRQGDRATFGRVSVKKILTENGSSKLALSIALRSESNQTSLHQVH